MRVAVVAVRITQPVVEAMAAKAVAETVELPADTMRATMASMAWVAAVAEVVPSAAAAAQVETAVQAPLLSEPTAAMDGNGRWTLTF